MEQLKNNNMHKILVLSDIHYGQKSSLFTFDMFKDLLEKEQPTEIYLLGDVVDSYTTGSGLIDLWNDFIYNYKKLFSLQSTIFLSGDNDTQENGINKKQEVITFLNSQGINCATTYKTGNMFFFHGNLETRHIEEQIGKHALVVLNKINQTYGPKLLASKIRNAFKDVVEKNDYVFIGHIHYLNKIDKNVFCGTFNTHKIVYNSNDSLGYVLIETTLDHKVTNVKIERF
jgi:predicted phosphodiesterase